MISAGSTVYYVWFSTWNTKEDQTYVKKVLLSLELRL